MAPPPEEQDFVRELRTRSQTEGGIFWAEKDVLGVFEPETAQKLNALNFHDMTLPDKLADLLQGRAGDPVSWKQVRNTWLAQMRHLATPERLQQLSEGMSALLDARLGRPLDLMWVGQEVSTYAMLPTVVSGLSARDAARIQRDQRYKLARLVALEPPRPSFWKELRSIAIQVSAGLVVRRELNGRAKGRRPRQVDLTDPIVDMLPALGMDRAVDAVTSVLTAVAGPPGAVAASLLYELTHRPDWAARLTEELGALAPEELYAAPTRAAPVTYRFVKETLRKWSPPIFLTRPVQTDIELEKVSLKKGQRYFASPYLIHHNPEHWKDPETFDPDRWLPNAENGPKAGSSYVPFGWAPTTCIGAGLGTMQLILLCHLVCTRYRIQLAEPDAARMLLAAVPMPIHFQGTISRR